MYELWIVTLLQREIRRLEQSERRELADRPTKVHQVWIRESLGDPTIAHDPVELYHALRFWKGERTKQNRIHRAENRRRRSDAEDHGRDDRDSREWATPTQAKRVASVSCERGPHWVGFPK